MTATSVSPRPSARVEVLLFAAGWGANHFSTLLVVYRKELALSPSELGLLFGIYALGLVPGLVLAGRASDRRGRRALVLPASLLAIGASTVLAFGGHGFGVLLPGRFMYGLAMGSVMSPGSVWVQELSSPAVGARRATLALTAGFGFGPLVSGIMAEVAPAPMILPFVVHGLVMALAMTKAKGVPETAPGLQTAASRMGRDAWIVLAELLPVAPWAFGFAAVAMAILPGLMRPHVARPVIYSGFVILTTLLSGVVVQPLAKRIGPRADLVGLGVGSLGVLLASYTVALASPLLVFGAAVLVGSAYGMLMTTGLLEISARVAKESKGSAVGSYYVLTYVGFALPFGHATWAKHLGDVTTLRITAAMALACLLLRALITARRASLPLARGH
jgi:MFS family permease